MTNVNLTNANLNKSFIDIENCLISCTKNFFKAIKFFIEDENKNKQTNKQTKQNKTQINETKLMDYH